MSNTPSELKYASSHEWARLESDGTVTVGISYHAQNSLGDVVFIELPEVGAEYTQGDEAAVVESVKAASDIYVPVSGEIIEVNEALDESPETVNEYPYSDGWFFRMQPSDISELDNLLDAEAYDEQCDE
ncbi:Glycine cleavage system H protein [Zhongshania aliphaticivorans]|uniref:Glycine cleavage system H protein n=1 Tax=Zhongshania aliphaticivorans TaxID=1470434 RepID=A0A5S9MSF3_9GAMM|nr:glycine cleavage system protein GcvH [Zhongshania aliphaticivorans]CAA0079939.1 Glycine cleavage system H protein [Zhongshania aliphaticivorans]CAA0085960.1 Glycine cleavage system H protein [Zhongshania aliphaticivorans]